MSGIHFDADAAGREVKAWKDRVAGGLCSSGYHGRSSKNIKIAAAQPLQHWWCQRLLRLVLEDRVVVQLSFVKPAFLGINILYTAYILT
ncbi:MAG: hypothetical protein ACLRXQ_09765 [Phascolarctobacterium faecium]